MARSVAAGAQSPRRMAPQRRMVDARDRSLLLPRRPRQRPPTDTLSRHSGLAPGRIIRPLMRIDALVTVRGGGDLATGVAYRLFRAGFQVLVTEISQPTVVRRTVSFAEAVYAGEIIIEGVTATR